MLFSFEMIHWKKFAFVRCICSVHSVLSSVFKEKRVGQAQHTLRLTLTQCSLHATQIFGTLFFGKSDAHAHANAHALSYDAMQGKRGNGKCRMEHLCMQVAV